MADNIGRYITAQQVKDKTNVGVLTDPEIESIIDLWMQIFDTKTKNIFNSRTLTLKFEGNNTSVVHLPLPIIQITSLKLNGSTSNFGLSGATIFDSRGPGIDDRRNPRIKLYSGEPSNIFVGSNSDIFIRGTITELQGNFGYLEADGTTPAIVQNAILAMVINDIKNPIDKTIPVVGDSGMLAQTKREKTDIHEIEFYEVKDGTSRSIFDLQSVSMAIKMYKAPTNIRGTIVDVARPTLFGYQ